MVLSQIPGSRATRTVALLALLPAALPAQGFFEQFSYEGLRLAGLGVEMGGVVSDRLTAEPTPALRVDYGVLAPRLRVMFGASYFRAEFNPDEIARFEQRLRLVVLDPTGDFTINVRSITWSQLALDGDLQYLFPADRVQTYLGLGIGVHVRDGDGTAIDGTFVEDALDEIGAGVNATIGAEFHLSPAWRFTLDGRGVIASGLSTVSLRSGIMYRLRAAR